ncbi:MAG: PEP-utilizing enzyme [Candidatus Paceibacterota bacterium]|jgi:phosphoenolpyruvate synthase/pyruvate phosphate dikinase
MNKYIFEKSYTRDTTILIQQIWAQQLSRGIKEKLGWQNPFLPIIIHHMIDGVVEVWDNQFATQWLKDKLLEQNLGNPDLLKTSLNEYRAQLSIIKEYWQNKSAKDIKEFREYLILLQELMFNFNLWYYTVTNEKTPKRITDEILDIRKDDTFFASNDIYIGNTIRELFPKIAKYTNVILSEEIESLPSEDELIKRMNNSSLIDGDILFVGSQEEFSKKYKQCKLNIERITENIKHVKGQVAFKGIVQGKVRILRRRDQVKDIQKDEIIVSPMTTPDFLPAMLKAAGFVTDEGGITCHAAIVARELKKPCIIGTKIATQVFKDGDLIEVDADKGIVRIINK